ncbi:MAG: hypothetical protein ABGZ53_32075 [Fuerstiella sp.]
MTETDLLTVATYTSASKARLVTIVLGGNGIQSAVVGDQIAEALGFFAVGLAKVELQVRRSDADEACRLLSEWEQESGFRKQDRWSVDSRMGWRCSSCSETNQQNFDECWSCSAFRQSDAKLVPLPDDLESHVNPPDLITAPENPDPSPFRVPNIENLPIRPSADAQLIDRTFRSAVFGMGIPPLAVYSSGLSWRCLSEGHPTPKVWAAMFISHVSVLMWLIVFFS